MRPFFYFDGLGALAYSYSELIDYEIMNLVDGRTPWTGDQPGARLLSTEDNTSIEKRRHPGLRTHDSSV
jgi:hypothetical protein